MAMNGVTLGDDIAAKLYASNASQEAKDNVKAIWEEVGKVIVKHIKDNLVVNIPSGAVIVQVTGGSGAPAVGVANVNPITVTVVG